METMEDVKLLKQANTLFAKLPNETQLWMLFCTECWTITTFHHKDRCGDCGHEYHPSKKHNEKCPKCKSDNYISLCKKCKSDDPRYLNDLLNDDDFEWSPYELKAIVEQLTDARWKKI